MDNQNVNPRMR